MPPRIFISYRTTDGADKATALARGLGRVFGDDQVFLDKDDLRGGSRWAAEIGRTLGARPVLLLLLTPGLLGAVDAQGRRRIDDPQDPVRQEVATALAAGAELIPLLADGVDALPAGDPLPPPLDRLGEHTWRRLRAYDWDADVQRVVHDLRALGVMPAAARRRRAGLVAAAGLLVAGGAALGWWRLRDPGVPGRWQATMGSDQVDVELRLQGDKLLLESHPMDIRANPYWAEYRSFWREQTGQDLDTLRYRGEGQLHAPPGGPVSVDIALRVVTVPGESEVDGGNLFATLTSAGRLEGRRWLNGAQAEQPAVLQRR